MAAARHTSRPRGPAYLHGGLALVLVMVVALAAVTFSQSPPPAIAEFAPQPAKQITESTFDQASRFGRGAGSGEGAADGAAAGASSTTSSPLLAVPALEKGRVRRCVGDPPRQI